MKIKTNTRKLKYGGVSFVLTVLVLTAVVILNVIVAALGQRYEWMYKDMTSSLVYSVSEDYEAYISDFIVPDVVRAREEKGNKEKVKIIFCDSAENIKADVSQKYVYGSVEDICELFGDYIEIAHINIWEQPSLAREYGASSTADIVCAFDGRYEALNVNDFFIFSADGSSAVAYNGEKMLAAALMRVTQKDTPVCYLTANHGEEFADYEFLLSLVQAGYEFSYIDLSSDNIPEDCELLITYDPKQDLISANEFSSISEVDKIENYMNNGGKYMVFLSADTFASGARENLEGFLSGWGVNYSHRTGEEGIEECYLIKDPSNSLTIDGYTVLSKIAGNDTAKTIFASLERPNVFGNTTAMTVADGFKDNGRGQFVAKVGGRERIVSPLLESYESAEAWAGGRAVKRAGDDPFMLMSVTAQKCENGETAMLLASASVDFATESAMKSAVIGNGRAISSIYQFMGKENAPTRLVFKPFASTEIESLTTSSANTITVVLALAPALLFGILGVVVTVRRRNL